jgi:hypothetical protein
MAIDVTPNTSEPSLTSLVNGIIRDAQDLVHQEIALARREVRDEIEKAKQAVVSLSVGVATAAVGGLFLLLMVVHILQEEAHLKLWMSYLIVGGILAVVGGVLYAMGRTKAGDIRLVPKQTAETLKENVQWLKRQT